MLVTGAPFSLTVKVSSLAWPACAVPARRTVYPSTAAVRVAAGKAAAAAGVPVTWSGTDRTTGWVLPVLSMGMLSVYIRQLPAVRWPVIVQVPSLAIVGCRCW